MEILPFAQRFMQIEEDLGLFRTADAVTVPWWDVVRHDVQKLVFARLTHAPVAAASPLPWVERLKNLATRLALRGQLNLRAVFLRHDVLVFRSPRIVRDGRRIDIALDHLLPLCPGRQLVIDSSPHRYDRSFSKPGQLAPRPAGLDRVEAEIEKAFGLKIDLDEFVRHRLHDFDRAHRRYAWLLRRVKPRLVLLSQDGIQKGLFRAVREARTPCIEAQHGLVNPSHPAYAYPRSVSGDGLSMFPDLLFAFSAFWAEGCHYPVRQWVAVGNDAFVPKTGGGGQTPGDILVIAADVYHDNLCRWLHATAPRLPQRRFVYKLHPNQARQVDAIRGELSALPNVDVVAMDRTVGDLLRDASDVLLIQSTVAYEALQSGKRVFIIREQDSGAHANLFGLPGVHAVRQVDELVAELGRPAAPFTPPTFFEPFNRPLAERVMRELMNGEASAPGRVRTRTN